MKSLVIFIVVLSLFIALATPVFARSGCCSRHSGVCGCGCCDGSPLSSTCLPYYPQCSGGAPEYTVPIVKPTQYVIQKPTPTNTPVSTIIPSYSPTPTAPVLGVTSNGGGNATDGLIGLGAFAAIGIGIARFIIKKGKTIPRDGQTS